MSILSFDRLILKYVFIYVNNYRMSNIITYILRAYRTEK